MLIPTRRPKASPALCQDLACMPDAWLQLAMQNHTYKNLQPRSVAREPLHKHYAGRIQSPKKGETNPAEFLRLSKALCSLWSNSPSTHQNLPKHLYYICLNCLIYVVALGAHVKSSRCATHSKQTAKTPPKYPFLRSGLKAISHGVQQQGLKADHLLGRHLSPACQKHKRRHTSKQEEEKRAELQGSTGCSLDQHISTGRWTFANVRWTIESAASLA